MSFSPSRLTLRTLGGLDSDVYWRMPDSTFATWHCALRSSCASTILPLALVGHVFWHSMTGSARVRVIPPHARPVAPLAPVLAAPPHVHPAPPWPPQPHPHPPLAPASAAPASTRHPSCSAAVRLSAYEITR